MSTSRSGGGGSGNSDWPSISADGTRIVYTSGASDLVSGDSNESADIFMYDSTTGETTLISQTARGNPANRASFSPAVSDDGSHIVFTSSATNLASNSGEFDNVYIYDIAAGSTELITHAPDGSPANYYGGYNPSVSADGSLVTYRSPASNLVADDTNNHDDVFLYDAASGTNELISRSPSGELGNGNSVTSTISADGTHIAFYSHATNLVSDDSGNAADVFLYDVAAGETTLISRTPEGQPANRDSFYPSISGDGTLVAYSSQASDLSGPDGGVPLFTNIFVFDSATGSTRLISKRPDGSPGTGNSDRADISVDGTYIGYESDANDLVSGDTDVDRHAVDVFLYRLS